MDQRCVFGFCMRAIDIDFWQMLGTWLVGFAGIAAAGWFVWRQNKILERQTSIMAEQNDLQANQRDLNQILIARESDAAKQAELERSIDLIYGGMYPKHDELDAELERLGKLGFSIRAIRASFAAMNRGVEPRYLTKFYEAIQGHEERQKRKVLTEAAFPTMKKD